MKTPPPFKQAATFFLAALIFRPASGNGAGTDTLAVRKAVLEAHDALSRAALDTDPSRMFAFILDAGPGVIIQNGVSMQSRQEALEAVKRGMAGVDKVERVYDGVRVTVLGPEAALVTGQGTAKITLTDGRVFESRFALTEVFVPRDGGWRLLHGHHSVPARP